MTRFVSFIQMHLAMNTLVYL